MAEPFKTYLTDVESTEVVDVPPTVDLSDYHNARNGGLTIQAREAAFRKEGEIEARYDYLVQNSRDDAKFASTHLGELRGLLAVKQFIDQQRNIDAKIEEEARQASYRAFEDMSFQQELADESSARYGKRRKETRRRFRAEDGRGEYDEARRFKEQRLEGVREERREVEYARQNGRGTFTGDSKDEVLILDEPETLADAEELRARERGGEIVEDSNASKEVEAQAPLTNFDIAQMERADEYRNEVDPTEETREAVRSV